MTSPCFPVLPRLLLAAALILPAASLPIAAEDAPAAAAEARAGQGAGAAADPIATPTPTATSWCNATPTPHAPFDGSLPPAGAVNRGVAHCMDDASERTDTGQVFVDWDTVSTGGRVDETDGHLIPYIGGFLFRDVRIPQGATITAATLRLSARGLPDPSTTLIVAGEDRANPADFSPANLPPDSRPRTEARVSWILGTCIKGWTDSPDISAVIQEIVGHDDWRPGNDLAILVDPAAGGKTLADWWAFDASLIRAARLIASYQAPPTRTPTATPSATATQTSTPTPTATPTSAPTETSTPTHTPTGAPTATSSATSTSMPTATATSTPTPTSTATPTPTATSTSTETPTPTSTATPTVTPTSTSTPTTTSTPTETPTATPTATLTITPTPTRQRTWLPIILR